MVRKSYNSGSYVAYAYNAEGSLARLSYGDSTGELASYRFEYDSLGRLIRSAELDADGGTVQRTEHIYDGYNRLSRQSWTLGGKTYTEYYSYDDATDGSMTSFRTTAEQTLHFTYDALRRLQRPPSRTAAARCSPSRGLITRPAERPPPGRSILTTVCRTAA